MPTLTQARNRANDWLTDRWPALVNRQEAFFAAHGRYWQGLRTHTGEPEHSTESFGDAIADRLGIKPSDETENWQQAFPALEGVNFPAALQIDVYHAPEGHGWVATIWVKFNGAIYSRSQNVGPLTELTKAWHQVEEADGLN